MGTLASARKRRFIGSSSDSEYRLSHWPFEKALGIGILNPRGQRLENLCINFQSLMDRALVMCGRKVMCRQQQHSALDGLLLEEIFQERTVDTVLVSQFHQRPLRTTDRPHPLRESSLFRHGVDSILQNASVRFEPRQSIGFFEN